jgi:hypothetical protein
MSKGPWRTQAPEPIIYYRYSGRPEQRAPAGPGWKRATRNRTTPTRVVTLPAILPEGVIDVDSARPHQ